MVCAIALSLGLAITPADATAQSTGLGNNAALKYWQAFGALPRRDAAQEKLLEKWRDMPLDTGARALVADAKQSLLYLQRGSRIQPCDWGLDFEDGGALLAQHLDRAMTLARLAGLRARLALADDDKGAAVADLLAALTLGRHCSSDGLIISLLVRASIESQVVDLLAAELPQLGGEARHKVSAGLSALPPGGTFHDAILKEKEIGHGWIVRKLTSMQDDPDRWRDQFIRLFSGKDVHSDEAEELRLKLAAAGNPSLEQLITWFRELSPFYDELAEMTALNNEEQFKVRLEELMAKYGRQNPVASLWLPGQGLFKVFRLEKRDYARMRMLEAAVAVAQKGQDALKDFEDPYGGGPFEYRTLPSGFELRSTLVVQGEPVVLKVGKAKP